MVTKLHVPRCGPRLVFRPRLSAELDDGVRGKLTLVFAPVGFGKTTAVAEWCRQLKSPSAWLSLDSGDNQPMVFWRYLAAALGPALPRTSGKLAQVLNSVDAPPINTLTTLLIDDMNNQPGNFTLVLDNYQMISDPAIHKSLYLLLQYIPNNLHLVIITRNVPPFELPLLRASGQLKEIGPNELRFSLEEVATFCGQRSLRLDSDEVKILADRTEGWIAGLFIAALAMEQREHAQFVRSYSGNNHELSAYLKQEVFDGWPKDSQEFLLQTSVLESLTGPLCDYVTGRNDSGEFLEVLAANNTFIFALDQEKCWYRYSRLFAEFLQDILSKKNDFVLTLLHRHAGVWYEKNGHIPQAISHFLAGGEFPRAAALIEKYGPQLFRAGELAVLMNLLKLLPASLIEKNPMLCLLNAWTLLHCCEGEMAEQWLGRVELICGEARPVKLSAPTCNSLLGEVALARANASHHNIARAKALLQQAYQRLPNGSEFLYIGIWVKTGMLSILRGLYDLTGNLGELEPFYQEMEPLLRSLGWDYGCGVHPVVISEVAYELNDLDKAMRMVLEGIRSAEIAGEAGILVPGLFVLARIRWARGDIDGALYTAREAEKRAHDLGAAQYLPQLTAFQVRLSLGHGGLGDVEHWFQNNGLGAYDMLTIEREYEYITLARTLIARKEWDQALLCLTRLLVFAEEKKRPASIIEVLNLQAVVYMEQGEHDKSIRALQESLFWGEGGGYLRSFIDEGLPMLELLANFSRWQRKHRRTNIKVSAQYVKNLSRLINDNAASGVYGALARVKTPSRQAEDLTKREFEVLRLLAQGLTYKEIAVRLTVSISTVKTYTGNIFSKLGVNNRTLAVERAREYGLL